MPGLPALISAPLTLLFLVACATLRPDYEPLRVSLVDLRVLDAQLFEQRYGLTLRLQNPNPVGFPIAGMSFNLEINGSEFAHGVSDRSIELPAFGEATTDVEVVSTLFGIIEQIRRLEDTAPNALSYKISGRIGLANDIGTIGFSREGTLGITRQGPPPAKRHTATPPAGH